MDLLGEASSFSSNGGRVLTARHISADRIPVLDDAVNATFICDSDAVPDVKTYLKAINVYGVVALTLGAAALLMLLALYCDTLCAVLRCRRADVKANSAAVTAVYLVVGAASYCAMIVPRAQLLAEAITQGVLMVSMYQLFCLFVAYCGGEAELIRRVKPAPLETRVAPCCCWPCCLLPRPPLNKRTLRWLRLLVLQLPVVQGALYIVLLVMCADEKSLYQVTYMYVQPVVVVSIVCGVWGMVMACHAAEGAVVGLHLKGKFLALQLVLPAAKLQGAAARILPVSHLLPCRPPITTAVYVNLIYNSLLLGEMVLLAVWARHLYRTTPDVHGAADTPRVQHVKVIGDLTQPDKVIDESPKFGSAKEGLFNISFDEDKN